MSQNKAGRTTVSHVFEGQLVVRFRGKACSIFFKAAAEKFKRNEPLLEIEQRCHDGVVKGGKSVCLTLIPQSIASHNNVVSLLSKKTCCFVNL